ncbi:MAG TPA: NAD(P)H-dependent glycerol-3-phosphate dehydrogenase [Verrucomicrobiae bacterium]|nr:NAD(P)H-dependent glycerol-3-phosphate dehydrogenase [Verrucomicrobiae bacterium]
MTVTVLGAGSWGLALAQLLHQRERPVRLWARRPEVARELALRRHHPVYLPLLALSEAITVTADLEAALVGAHVVVLAVPTTGMRQVAGAASPFLSTASLVVSAGKGLEPDTGLTMTTVLRGVLPEQLHAHLAVLGGPNIAHEVAAGLPSAAVLAASDDSTAHDALRQLAAPGWRLYSSRDPLGVEVAGALKNVVAIAAGICDGLGVGDNAKAALMTRGLAEMTRLGVRVGANPFTFGGLAGVGDCLVTCMSPHSRNRQLGEALGRGASAAEVRDQGPMVVEGVNVARAAVGLAQRHRVELPITQEVHALLFQGKTVADAARDIMQRDLRPELVPQDLGLPAPRGQAADVPRQ